jgi:hypothetical protein
MTESQVARLVGVLMAAYPSSRATAETSAVYERMLMDLDHAAANAAVERLLATAKFMPTVAEIRESTMLLSVGERKPGGQAWGGVLKAIRGEGVYRRPGKDFVFSDRVAARCVDALGWDELCNSENITADRARFIELYDQLAVQDRQRQLSDSLPAMTRFRAIEAARTAELEDRSKTSTPATAAIGKVLQIVDVAPTEPS